jgi:hypothetical protein
VDAIRATRHLHSLCKITHALHDVNCAACCVVASRALQVCPETMRWATALGHGGHAYACAFHAFAQLSCLTVCSWTHPLTANSDRGLRALPTHVTHIYHICMMRAALVSCGPLPLTSPAESEQPAPLSHSKVTLCPLRSVCQQHGWTAHSCTRASP